MLNYVKSILRLKCSMNRMLKALEKKIADLEILNKLDDTLDRDPNYNYEIVSTLLQNAKSKHIPKQIKKFNKRRHKKEKWMADKLLAQAVKKITCMLIKKTTIITYPDHEKVKLKFKGYEKIVSNGIDKAKK